MFERMERQKDDADKDQSEAMSRLVSVTYRAVLSATLSSFIQQHVDARQALLEREMEEISALLERSRATAALSIQTSHRGSMARRALKHKRRRRVMLFKGFCNLGECYSKQIVRKALGEMESSWRCERERELEARIAEEQRSLEEEEAARMKAEVEEILKRQEVDRLRLEEERRLSEAAVERARLEREKAARVLQGMVRGHVGRRETRALESRWWGYERALWLFSSALETRSMSRAFREAASHWSKEKAAWEAREREAACIKIQSIARGFTARRRHSKMKELAKRPGHNARKRAAARAKRSSKKEEKEEPKRGPITLGPLHLRPGEDKNLPSPSHKEPGPLTLRLMNGDDLDGSPPGTPVKRERKREKKEKRREMEQEVDKAEKKRAEKERKRKERRREKEANGEHLQTTVEDRRDRMPMRSQSHLGMRCAPSWDAEEEPRRSHSSMDHHERERYVQKSTSKWDRAGQDASYSNGTKEDVLLANIVRRIDNGVAKNSKYASPIPANHNMCITKRAHAMPPVSGAHKRLL